MGFFSKKKENTVTPVTFIEHAGNHVVVDFNTLANIEPLVLDVYNYPVGTDLEYHCDSTGRYFTDNRTGKRI